MSGNSIWETIEEKDPTGVERYHLSGGSMSKTNMITGDSLLQHALDTQSKECFSLLLELGAPSDIRRRDGTFVIHWAAAKKDSWWLEMLISHGADVNAWGNGKGSQVGTPVSFAIMNGLEDNVRLLVGGGLELDIPVDEQNLTAVTDASLHGKYRIVALLLEAGASPTAGNLEGKNLIGSLHRRGLDSNHHKAIDSVIYLLDQRGFGKEVFSGSYFGNRSYEKRLAEETTKRKK